MTGQTTSLCGLQKVASKVHWGNLLWFSGWLLALFPSSRVGEEEREPGIHCSRMCQVPLATCILLRCTKIAVNSVYLLKGHTA